MIISAFIVFDGLQRKKGFSSFQIFWDLEVGYNEGIIGSKWRKGNINRCVDIGLSGAHFGLGNGFAVLGY